MTELTPDLSLAQAHFLIDSYPFDLGGDDVEQLLEHWLDRYDASWIRLATIEAVYLVRYKTIFIEDILNRWLRMNTFNPHFPYEYERFICRKLPKHLSDLSEINHSKTEETIGDENTTHQNTQPNLLPSTATQNETSDHQKASTESTSSFNNIPLISVLRFSQHTDWTEFTRGDNKIHQFIPLPDVSSFFNKLKTFGEEKLES